MRIDTFLAQAIVTLSKLLYKCKLFYKLSHWHSALLTATECLVRIRIVFFWHPLLWSFIVILQSIFWGILYIDGFFIIKKMLNMKMTKSGFPVTRVKQCNLYIFYFFSVFLRSKHGLKKIKRFTHFIICYVIWYFSFIDIFVSACREETTTCGHKYVKNENVIYFSDIAQTEVGIWTKHFKIIN